MVATAPAPPSSGPPGLEPSAGRAPRYLLWGAILVALALAAAGAIIASFDGTFTSYTSVTAQLPASSTAVALNSPVEFRDVTVGKVSSQGRSVAGGLVSVVLHMKPGSLNRIPAGVRATVTPVSFFGNEYIVLQPPAHPGPARLRPGQVIPAVTTGETASLQSTLGSLDYLINSLHPAQLDAALTAVAQALQGQGTSLGQNLVDGNTYLKGMLPLWPTVVADLNTLVPVSNTFTDATPNILAILSNQTVTGQTVTGDVANLQTALGTGAAAVARASQLLNAIQQPFVVLANDSGPFLDDIGQNPHEISQLLGGLSTWAQSWLAAESSGPYLSLRANVSVSNPADLGLAVLGGSNVTQALSLGLGSSYVNPPPYTAANCPHFGALSGCGGTTIGTTSAVLAEPAQSQSIGQIVQSATGQRPANPSVAALLLSPVLEGLESGT